MPEITVSGPVGGKTLSFSTGKLAGQADGAVVAEENVIRWTGASRDLPTEWTDRTHETLDGRGKIVLPGHDPESGRRFSSRREAVIGAGEATLRVETAMGSINVTTADDDRA